jgi:transcriptional regulator with XRE-family HTH domain
MMPLNLTKVRQAMGDRSIAEVARAMGAQPPSLSRILSGRKPDVPMSTVDRLAAALGVKAAKLID